MSMLEYKLILVIKIGTSSLQFSKYRFHDDATAGKRFLHHWTFVRGIHQLQRISDAERDDFCAVRKRMVKKITPVAIF